MDQKASGTSRKTNSQILSMGGSHSGSSTDTVLIQTLLLPCSHVQLPLHCKVRVATRHSSLSWPDVQL